MSADPKDAAVLLIVGYHRAVTVLDGWAASDAGMAYSLLYSPKSKHWTVRLNHRQRGPVSFHGETPDRARAKAAAAIERGEV